MRNNTSRAAKGGLADEQCSGQPDSLIVSVRPRCAIDEGKCTMLEMVMIFMVSAGGALALRVVGSSVCCGVAQASRITFDLERTLQPGRTAALNPIPISTAGSLPCGA